MRSRQPRRSGYVLVAVLMVIVVLSLVSYRFADAMASEQQVAYRSGEAAQAKAFAISGIHYAMGVLADPASLSNICNDYPYDNYAAFANIPVSNEGPRGGGRFAIIGVAESEGGSSTEKYVQRYGVVDEAGKVNLNTMMRIDSSGEALRAMLILLPNMTEDVADAIADWLDSDDDQRANGAESAAYPNYRPRNGPINTLDELILVQGVTTVNLFGNDRNRNGVQDADEVDGTDFNRGWSDYLTVYGHELNVDSTGQPRLYVNDADMATVHKNLSAILGQDMADYTMAYRMYSQQSSLTPASGNTRTGSATDLRTAVQTSLASARPRRQVRNSLLSMVNTRVTLPRAANAPQNEPTVVVNCPLNDAAYLKSILPTLLDKVTAKSNYELNPRINVNTAPQTLLMVLPGVTAEDAAASIAARANLDPLSAEYRTGAWLHTQAGMRMEIFKNIETYITGYTQTYRIQSIGYFARGGPVARVEAVIDTNGGQPRIVYYRDLTELGGGFAPPRE
jgi:type II secretory pathway component PulK